MSEHTITQLSALSGLSVRTIRYYLAQGLIPAAGMEGPSSRYPEATLARLRLIARLRDAHLPLAEIRKQLLALSDDEVLALAGTPVEAEPAGSALDYVRSVLDGSRAGLRPSPLWSTPALNARVPPAPERPAVGGDSQVAPIAQSGSLLRRVAPHAPSRGTTGEGSGLFAASEALPAPAWKEAPATPAADEVTPFGQRSQWDRVAITTDIELHIRRPLSRRDNRLVERLLAFARQLGEEQP